MSTVFVHGLGYVGLPTAAMFANYGHDVTGYDTDDAVVECLRGGGLHIEEPGLRAFVTQALESGKLTVAHEVDEAKYHVIAVPTPYDRGAGVPDLQYVRAAADAIAPHLRTGDTVVLESTVPPTTTVDVLRPVLERSGLSAGTDFALVYCPETVLPGNIITELKRNDRIVGGVNGVSTEAAVRLYESFVEGEIYTAADATTAEVVKLTQNTFRDVNIALANELALVSRDYGVDSRRVRELANVHPRVDVHHPGPGVGGHCLPVDPWFLGYDSDSLRLVPVARAVNDGMSDHVVELLEAELGSLAGRRIALLGVAYKRGVGDTRRSPALAVAAALRDAVEEERAAPTDGGAGSSGGGIDVRLHDPHVDDESLGLVDFDRAVADADAAVVVTGHEAFTDLDPERVRDAMAGSSVVDTRAVLSVPDWEAAGFTVRRI
ncbi:nucleotide sugar dehydrogenase [Halorubrum sp. DM2]|uniref:nucleotide sugar dehydrogenase n=1 Tax=Halorubrum sp. DM2 TaxID=2527867 RepID=UPI0024B6B19B|nr:nucleotide sugar dehydrogenase [Halorubrum sp. DM2]